MFCILLPQPKYLIISLDGAMKKVLRSSTRGSQLNQVVTTKSRKTTQDADSNVPPCALLDAL